MGKIKATIAGGTGYTAGELIRILINHPEVEITNVMSTTQVGDMVSDVHRDLFGDCDLRFTDQVGEPDVLFLCLGHGISREFLSTHNISEKCSIIDLGNDFRIESNFMNREFVYGLCEMNRESIKGCYSVANPGCFATSIELGILPLLDKNMVNDEIHVHAITGSTGAGKTPVETTHFSYRDNNISVYKSFRHQHLAEISKVIRTLSGKDIRVNFVPMRGDFTRGIFASIYTRCESPADEAVKIYTDYYKSSPFVHVSDTPISLKEVVNTNKGLLHIASYDGYLHITSVIDNLVKGASGQAIQNMNLMFGYDESAGLRLKSTTF
jgi:N-acetyl-gamma-glutamyl-phosphate reductase